MFTGLVEAIGTLTESRATPSGRRLRIASPLAGELSPGDSIAVNGVCLTALVADPREIHLDVGPETLRVTTLGRLEPYAVVNLERAMRADARVGGHFVQGHVDATGTVEQVRPEADCCWMAISLDANMAPYLVSKGSITVDGVSLTVATLGRGSFEVQLIPFTLEHTNLKHLTVGDRVNLECDMIGKYVVRAIELAGLSFAAARPTDVRH